MTSLTRTQLNTSARSPRALAIGRKRSEDEVRTITANSVQKNRATLTLVTPFYDNLEPTPIDESPILVEIERIYCLDWPRFGESDDQALAEIYEQLPGYVGSREITWWFGDQEEEPPFLSASREPPGLQVYGILPLNEWLAWDAAFRAAACDLPMRTV